MLQIQFTGFEQKLFFRGESFIAKIYEGIGDPPKGFNTICISLDCSDRSLLQWHNELSRAQELTEKGFLILWELEFHLLEGCLEDEARFLSLQLNIQHFLDTVWPHFASQTIGISLYKGSFDDATLGYLKSLAAVLPEEASCFIFLDTSRCQNEAAYFQLLDLEKFGHFHLILKGPFAERYPWLVPALSWGHGNSPLGFCSSHLHPVLPQQRITEAICLPRTPDWRQIEQVIKVYGERPFRMIPENLLTQEWDGIDHLLVFHDALTDRLRRKLNGFTAAGGAVNIF